MTRQNFFVLIICYSLLWIVLVNCTPAVETTAVSISTTRPTEATTAVPTVLPSPTIAATETTVPTALPSPTATETAVPTAAPVFVTSGISAVDEAVRIILSNDVESRRALVQYTTAGCTTSDGLGGPPKCTADQTDGTLVTYFPVLGPGEGGTVLPENIAQALSFEVITLLAAYQGATQVYDEPIYPAGVYGLMFALEGPGVTAVIVRLDEQGKIVRLDYQFEADPQAVIDREAPEQLFWPEIP